MMKKILPFLLLMILISVPAQAQEGPTEGAACSGAGRMSRAGGPEITSPNGGNWLICNGSNWIMAWNFGRDARSQVQFDYDTGSCTSLKTGRIRYNSSTNIWDFCNGIGWTTFARQGATNDCNYWGQAPGYICPDGTVFVGFLPDGSGTPIFTTRCDVGRTWNGSSCTGTRTNYSWGSSGTARGTTDLLRGDNNTATLDAISGTGQHAAAEHCAARTDSGRTDWYLPAIGEVILLAAHVSSISDMLTSLNYSSSTEVDASSSLLMQMNVNATFSGGKGASNPVRCIRRGH